MVTGVKIDQKIDVNHIRNASNHPTILFLDGRNNRQSNQLLLSFEIEDFEAKFKDLIYHINMYAPVKIISKNKDEKELIIMFNEIIDEIKKIDLRERIESLENKVSLNLDEKLYSELLSLRNQLKSG